MSKRIKEIDLKLKIENWGNKPCICLCDNSNNEIISADNFTDLFMILDDRLEDLFGYDDFPGDKDD